MKRQDFEKLFLAFIDSDSPSSDMDDAYDTYNDLLTQINDGNDFIISQMFRMSEMDTSERLRWRMAIAEQGIEMTPIQVDEYIILLELALSHNNPDDLI